MSGQITSSSFTRPRLGFVEVCLLLFRSIPLMLCIFLPIFLAGLYLAFQMEKQYVAASRILVSPSEEYVFRPQVGESIPNTLPERDQLTSTEIQILVSPVVAERVMEKIGLETLYPKVFEKLSNATADEKYEIAQEGLLALRENFEAYSIPKQSVIYSSFKHKDPQLSADVVNTWLETYIDYRREIFEDRSPASLGSQREQFEGSLDEAEEELRQFLLTNQIGDFATERTTLQTLFVSAQEALFANTSRQSEIEGEMMRLRQQIQIIDPEIDIFTQDSSSESIVALELEREDLLTRYTPESQAVADINQRIARAKQYVDSAGRPVGTVRRGPNPLFQTVETRLTTLSAEFGSLRIQKIELERQLSTIEARQRRLAKLEPVWQKLVRSRDLLESNARNFATREAEARSLAEIARLDSDNIRILEPARRPAKGESLKAIVAIASFVLALLTAVLIALARIQTRKGFSTPGSLERTIGLPVVATVKSYK